ncbi:hypothetical protein Vadar_024812 [Vaccinium darrowii]|uniref:Uncharacterized protein n=1 Tax=Vaccinium darrowii TaxID=229202 RepID=A0ACB7Y9X3_9ERIC|nr:hypothetical protein Vadar_024812 [Vaccinium darrowii]
MVGRSHSRQQYCLHRSGVKVDFSEGKNLGRKPNQDACCDKFCPRRRVMGCVMGLAQIRVRVYIWAKPTQKLCLKTLKFRSINDGFHLPPVRDQGDHCTCCSIVAVIQCISSYYSIVTGNPPPLLSIQEPLNEIPSKAELSPFINTRRGHPCFTSWPAVPFSYSQRYQVGLEVDMPYVACPHDRHRIMPGPRMGIEDYVVLNDSSCEEVSWIVDNRHPVVGVFRGFGLAFARYVEGVYRGQYSGDGDYNICHSVLIIGSEPDYFIIQNSAGRSWGMNGYGYVSKSLFCQFSYPIGAPTLTEFQGP